MITLVPLAAIDPPAVERLLDRAFGTDRQQRTAYHVRAGVHSIAAISFAALETGELIGSIQCWPVAHRGDDGVSTPLVMVGPVAVDPARQRDGIGKHLMNDALAGADGLALMLIGDPDYYARVFGFTADRTGKWRLPGPFEPRRLLARGPGVPTAAGAIGPRQAGITDDARLPRNDANGRAA